MTRRAALLLAVPLTILAVLLVLAVGVLSLLAIWGDPALQDQLVATAFLASFSSIFAGGAAGFAWIHWEYSR